MTKTLLTVVTCFFSLFLCAQNPNWLPKGTIFNYGDYDWSGNVNFEKTTVIDAFEDNGVDVRILKRANGCTALPVDEIFTLHRRGDKVYYVFINDMEYLLYDFGAIAGESVEVVYDFDDQGQPVYTEMMIESIDTLHLNDTFLLVQTIDKSYLEYTYGDVIIDIGATGPMFPGYALVDPGCPWLVSYDSPATGTLCFFNSACQLIRTDFDYSPFRTDQGVYYAYTDNEVYAIKLEGAEPGSDTAVLIPQASIVSKSSDCAVVDEFGWAFDRVELYDTTHFALFNLNDEGISIYLDRNVGDEWICFNVGDIEITAYVKQIDTATVLVSIDTVMTIGFIYTDDPQSQLNSIELKISKTRGLVQLFSFLQFPEYAYTELPYELLLPFKYKGHDWPGYNFSPFNAKWDKVNFHIPGEVLHVEESFLEGGTGYLLQDKLTYIGMESVIDTDYLLWSRHGRHFIKNAGEEDQVDIVRDTIRVEYDKNFGRKSGFNLHPGDAIVQDSTEASYSYTWIFNGHGAKTLERSIWTRYDTCWVTEIITSGISYDPTWISRLSGPYYDEYETGPEFVIHRKLEYYKLSNGEEWGEPFDFTVSTTDLQGNIQVAVYPNPASDFIFVKGELLSSKAHLELFDTSGRLCLKISPMTSDAVNVSQLEVGLYIYRVIDGDMIATGKLVVGR